MCAPGVVVAGLPKNAKPIWPECVVGALQEKETLSKLYLLWRLPLSPRTPKTQIHWKGRKDTLQDKCQYENSKSRREISTVLNCEDADVVGSGRVQHDFRNPLGGIHYCICGAELTERQN